MGVIADRDVGHLDPAAGITVLGQSTHKVQFERGC